MKKETEFNLSEKIQKRKIPVDNINWILEEDVKEFIRLLKDNIEFIAQDPYDGFDLQLLDVILKETDKLAGDKLI